MEMVESWATVIDWSKYEVSVLGRVRRDRKVIRWYSHNGDYPRIRLSQDGRRKNPLVHKLVMEAFVGSRPHGMETNHKDGNKQNPQLTNLEYVTTALNAKHAHDIGLFNKAVGVYHQSAKLNDVKVRRIRKLSSQGFSGQQIAAKLNVAQSTIWRIIKGKTWKHLK